MESLERLIEYYNLEIYKLTSFRNRINYQLSLSDKVEFYNGIDEDGYYAIFNTEENTNKLYRDIDSINNSIDKIKYKKRVIKKLNKLLKGRENGQKGI